MPLLVPSALILRLKSASVLAPTFIVALWLLAALALSPLAIAQSVTDRVNRGVVTIMAGGINGTYIRVATDLSNVLDSDDLRVLPVIGKGSVKNMEDLLYLKGIDIAIVQSDVLSFLKRTEQSQYRSIDRRIRYVTKLYNEEFHLLAGPGIEQISDLAGKIVNFDNQGSGTAMTASLVFEKLGVAVNPAYHSQTEALEKLRGGEIAALVYVAGKPTRFFEQIDVSEDLRLVPITMTPELLQTYLPTRLRHDDYPQLIAEQQTVSTLAVGAVMAVINWRRGHPRYRKAAHLVERFFDSFETLLNPPWHPKWREVNLAAVVPGWQRFAPAENWLRERGQLQ